MLSMWRHRRGFSRVAAGFIALSALIVGIAAGASAHSVLLGTDPEDEAQLAAAPDEVSLTFNEDITDLGTEVIITTGDGEDVSEGETQIAGPVVTQALADARPAGTYTVTWRAVSADGHPISGEFSFTAAEAAGLAPAEEQTEDPAEDPAETGPAETGPSETDDAAGTDATTDGADADADDADSSGISGGTWVIIAVVALAVIVLVTLIVRGMTSDRAKK